MIYELKPKTKESLKAIDAAIAQQTKAINEQAEAYKKTVNALQVQKNMLLSTVIEEKEIDVTLKLKLNEEYNIEVITQEQYDKMMGLPNSLELDVPVNMEKEAPPKQTKKK